MSENSFKVSTFSIKFERNTIVLFKHANCEGLSLFLFIY